MEQRPSIRVSANAVIIRDNALLLVEFGAGWSRHFNLPGGGIEPHESITAGLQREVREETSAEVIVGSLLLTFEYFPPHFDQEYGSQHKLSLIFRCELLNGSEPQLPLHPDPHQVAIQWVPLSELSTAPLIPAFAHRLLEGIHAPMVYNPFRDRL